MHTPSRIETLPLTSLLPYAGNPRAHSKSQVAAIAASMRRFGWTLPVLIDDGNNVIAGHGRLLAAAELGITEVPAIRLAHLTPDEARAYRIADNQLVLAGEWDENILKLELTDLDRDSVDLSVLGFSQADLARLLSSPDLIVDPDKAWNGMPDYAHDDLQSFAKVVVHFKDQDSLNAFAALLGRNITDRTRAIWYPEAEIGHYADREYTDE